MEWEVEVHWIAEWLTSCDSGTRVRVAASLRMLSLTGPGLGRPLVDTVRHSRHRNMKELRPQSVGSSELRILFAFDPRRTAVMLVAGDKRGAWNRWYAQNIPIADSRFDVHLQMLRRKGLK